MDPLLIFPDPPPPELAQTLDLAGYAWKAVANSAVAEIHERDRAWGGAILVADEDPDGAISVARALRKRDRPFEGVLLLINGGQLSQLESRHELFDDFCLTPFQPRELEARLVNLFYRTGRAPRPELIECGDLQLNVGTYQAA
ncbi:MAG: hypothetical protein ACC660_07205, partial [Acidimicrobiales bacterium]